MGKLGGKKKKRSANSTFNLKKRDMIYKTSDQEYGIVQKLLGDMRCLVLLPDKTEKNCKICGSFKRRVWINIGDIVLISIRSFEDKGDIIYKYTPEEGEYLKTIGELNINQEENNQQSLETLYEDDLNDEEVDLQDL